MTFDQVSGVFALVLVALPLGAIALVAALYAAIVLGRMPETVADGLADIFERVILRPYCWVMVTLLIVCVIFVAGWTERVLLGLVAMSFVAGIVDLLPRLRQLKQPRSIAAGSASKPLVGLRRLMAGASAGQWLIALVVYVRMVT